MLEKTLITYLFTVKNRGHVRYSALISQKPAAEWTYDFLKMYFLVQKYIPNVYKNRLKNNQFMIILNENRR